MADLSIDLESIVVEDDSFKEEEEEERQKELNGILATAFDDLSSVTEDDDDDDDDCSINGENQPRLDSSARAALLGNVNGKPVIMTSTPQCPSSSKRVNRTFEPQRSPIEEIEEVDVQDDVEVFAGTENHKETTIECFRGVVSPKIKYMPEDSQIEGPPQHVQMLLDHNERLEDENRELLTRLNVCNGDYESLRHQYATLEAASTEKEDEIARLKGKISALEVQIKAEAEAKNSYCNKLLVAEATIEPLKDQINELSHNDSLARLKESHEALLSKMRTEYESRIGALTDEVNNLRWEAESKKQEAILLSNELMQKEKCIEALQVENRNFTEQLATLKPGSTTRVLNIDENHVSDEKDDRIACLEMQMRHLKQKLEDINESAAKKVEQIPNAKNVYDSVILDLQVELERALKNAEMRREQNSYLQNQLQNSKAELTAVKERLKLKEEEVEIERRKMELKSREEKEKEEAEERVATERENLKLKNEVAKLSEQVKRCTDLSAENLHLREELTSAKASYSVLLSEKAELNSAYTRLKNDLKSKLEANQFSDEAVEAIVSKATEQWRKDAEEKILKQAKQDIEAVRKRCEQQKNAEVLKIKQDIKKQLEEVIKYATVVVENDGTELDNLPFDRTSLAAPLQKFCVEFEVSFRRKRAVLLSKTQQMKEARQQLQEALRESQNCDVSQNSRDLKLEVEELRSMSALLQAKISKYKKHYHRLLDMHEKEVAELKQEVVDALRSQNLKAEAVVDDLNEKHFENLEKIKTQAEMYLLESSKRVMENISQFISDCQHSLSGNCCTKAKKS